MDDSAVSVPLKVLPKIVIGTSCLGNLYKDIGYDSKRSIIENSLSLSAQYSLDNLIFDTAGKYGCGLALETLGKILKDLSVPPSDVRISNKLGWRRAALNSGLPGTCAVMEPGVWVNLEYDGMVTCFMLN